MSAGTAKPPPRAAILALLGGALVLHGVLMPSPGWERDLYWFGTWMRTAVERGVPYIGDSVWCDYPPVYLYLLKGLGLLWIAVTAAPLPADGTLALRLLLKLLPVAADIAGAVLLYRIALERGLPVRTALTVLAAYAYNPALLVASAVWGQADSLVALLLLLSAWILCRGHIAVAMAIATATVLLKLQAVVVLPALLVAAVHRGGHDALFTAARAAALTALVLLLPYFAADRIDPLLANAFGASGRYPFISMNAHNLWWLIGGPASPTISDVRRVGNGLLTLRALGGIMVATAVALVLWRLWRDLFTSRRDRLAALVEACALLGLAFYLFPTEMHERYLLPVLIFLAATCLWRPAAWWAYLACSAAAAVSLVSTLNGTFPRSLGPVAALLPASRIETTVVAVFLLGLFLALLFWTTDRRFQRSAALIIAAAGLGILAITRAPIRAAQPLGDWDPVSWSQEWGSPQRNRSVDRRRLSAAGFVFRRGIGTHANSLLTYHVNGAFEFFETAYAIDDEANRGQRVRFRIVADNAVLFDSGDIAGVGPPGHVRVPIAGVEHLTLQVLAGGDGIHSDHADWLEPLLIR